MGVRLFDAEPAVEPAWRTLEYFALARVLVASALVLSVAAFGAPPGARGAVEPDGPNVLAGSLVYFALAAGLAIAAFFVRRRFMLQVASQLAVDLAVISSMLVLGGGLRSGVMILYLLPLAGASLLLPTAAAFFVCSIAVIALLVDAFLRQLQGAGADALVFQAGLYGAALFAITGLLRLLSARLAALALQVAQGGLGKAEIAAALVDPARKRHHRDAQVAQSGNGPPDVFVRFADGQQSDGRGKHHHLRQKRQFGVSQAGAGQSQRQVDTAVESRGYGHGAVLPSPVGGV